MDFAIKGKKYLEFKQKQLKIQIDESWEVYNTLRKKFIDLFRKSVVKLNQTQSEMGSEDFKLISSVSRVLFNPQINVKYIKNIGIIVPKIEFLSTKREHFPAYSFENTSPYLDDLINDFLKRFLTKLLHYAEIEGVLLNFATNYKMLNRRVKRIENILIPELKFEIKKIKGILEEMERENFVRSKKIKDLLNKNLSVS